MIFAILAVILGWRPDQYGGFIAMYDLGLTMWKTHSTATPRPWDHNLDPFTRVKHGPNHRQFLQSAAASCGAATLPASLGMDEAFAQRRQQHAGRLRAWPRRTASTLNSTSAQVPSTPLGAEVAGDGVNCQLELPRPDRRQIFRRS
jgi:hypothetical protein